jgi:hypothetical protein
MDGVVSRFDQFCLPEMIWDLVQNILPKHRKSRKGGRPRKEFNESCRSQFLSHGDQMPVESD